jgi:metal-sulfur cluster biosynthetic enzyme
MINKEQILEKLKTVFDPEVHVDVVTMGLIYDIQVDEEKKSVALTMTYTTPFCPFGHQLTSEIKDAIIELGFLSENVSINVTFDPPWEAPPNLRMAMGV